MENTLIMQKSFQYTASLLGSFCWRLGVWLWDCVGKLSSFAALWWTNPCDL